MEFFKVIALCHSLDLRHTDVYSGKKRTTHIYIRNDGVCVKVLHMENGASYAYAADFTERDDLGLEIRSMHQIIDDKIRYQKLVVEDPVDIVPF